MNIYAVTYRLFEYPWGTPKLEYILAEDFQDVAEWAKDNKMRVSDCKLLGRGTVIRSVNRMTMDEFRDLAQ